MSKQRVDDNRYNLIASSFRDFDADGNNSISREELEDIMFKISDSDDVSVIEGEIDSLMKLCDKDGNGSISFAEFFAAMKTTTDPDDPANKVMQQLVNFFAKDKKEQNKILEIHAEHYNKLHSQFEHIGKQGEHDAQEEQRLKEERERNEQEYKQRHENSIHELKNDINVLQQEKKDLEASRTAVEAERKKIDEEAHALREKVLELEASVTSQKEESDKLKHEEEDIRLQLKAEVTKHTQIITALEQEKTQLSARVSELDKKIEEKNNEYHLEITRLQKQAEEDLSNLRLTIKSLEDEKVGKEQGKQENDPEHHQQELVELRKQLEVQAQELKKSKQDIDDVHKQRDSEKDHFKSQHDALGVIIQKLEAQLKEASEAHTHAKHELEVENTQLKAQLAAVAKPQEGVLAREIPEEIADLRKQLETVQLEKAGLEKKGALVEKLTRDIETAQEQISTLQEKLEFQATLLSSAENDDDEDGNGGGVLALKAEIAKKDAELEELRKTLREKVEAETEAVDLILQRQDEGDQAQNELREKLEEKAIEIEDLEDKLEESTRAKLALEQVKKEIQKEIVDRDVIIENIRKQIETERQVKDEIIENLRKEAEAAQQALRDNAGRDAAKNGAQDEEASISPGGSHKTREQVERELTQAQKKMLELSRSGNNAKNRFEKVLVMQISATAVLFLLIVGLLLKTRLIPQIDILKKLTDLTRAKMQNVGIGLPFGLGTRIRNLMTSRWF